MVANFCKVFIISFVSCLDFCSFCVVGRKEHYCEWKAKVLRGICRSFVFVIDKTCRLLLS